MKKFLQAYFTFTRNEQRGILVLIFLIFFVFVLPYAIKLFQGDKVYDASNFEEQVAAFEKALAFEESNSIEYFTFNPNELDLKEFLNLGLSKKQAYNIINYRKAGGSFKDANDFSKIYSISDSLFLLLKPYIKIPDQVKAKKSSEKISSNKKKFKKVEGTNKDHYSENEQYKKKPIKEEIRMVEINSADSTQLISLKGIGPVFAHRILSYRYYLGGFYKIEQLKEVYGLKDETFQKIYPFIALDTSQIIKIDLNKATFKEINRHPYISFNQTKSLMNYRDLMKRFEDVEEIIANHLIDSLSFQKVKPYLMTN